MTTPLPPEERHDDPRQVLIDALLRHQKRDIKSCDCGTWGSDHGHLGQRHSVHVVDRQIAALAAAGYQVVKVTETQTEWGARWTETGDIYGPVPKNRAEHLAGICHKTRPGYELVAREVGPWRPVGEGAPDVQ